MLAWAVERARPTPRAIESVRRRWGESCRLRSVSVPVVTVRARKSDRDDDPGAASPSGRRPFCLCPFRRLSLSSVRLRLWAPCCFRPSGESAPCYLQEPPTSANTFRRQFVLSMTAQGSSSSVRDSVQEECWRIDRREGSDAEEGVWDAEERRRQRKTPGNGLV